MTSAQLARLAEAAAAARAQEAINHVPAALTVAQWALESAWGKRSPGNNCFGIKYYEGAYGRQLLHTTEWFTSTALHAFLTSGKGRTATAVLPIQVDAEGRCKYDVTDYFATFPTLDACFAKHNELFTRPPYADALAAYQKDGDLEAFVRSIAVHYATSPIYAEQILEIIRMPEVQRALNISAQTH